MKTLRTLTHMKKAIFTALAVASLAILPATAQAVPIVGTLDLTGAVRVTPNAIDWLPQDMGFGIARIEPTSTGYFAVLGNTAMVEKDLSLLTSPVGVTGLNIDKFESTLPDSPLPGLNFILDIIVSCGQASLHPADECAAGLDSPFRFDEDTDGTTVILNFRGTVIDTNNPGEISTFQAKFDATFTGLTPQDILDQLVANGEIFTVYSARKITIDRPDVPTIPEPATMLTFGAGTALLAAHRRRAKKAAK